MLTERQRRLYARQVILRELGQTGQAQLCASQVAAAAGSDPAAAEVALDYLRRAGLQVLEATSPERDASEPQAVAATSAQVRAIAEEPELRACAEWLLGAWAAVETIKRCGQVGQAAAQIPLRPWHVEEE